MRKTACTRMLDAHLVEGARHWVQQENERWIAESTPSFQLAQRRHLRQARLNGLSSLCAPEIEQSRVKRTERRLCDILPEPDPPKKPKNCRRDDGYYPLLPNDSLKIPLARQPVQSAPVGVDVIEATQPMRTFPARDHTAQPALPFEQRKVPQVLAGGCHFPICRLSKPSENTERINIGAFCRPRMITTARKTATSAVVRGEVTWNRTKTISFLLASTSSALPPTRNASRQRPYSW